MFAGINIEVLVTILFTTVIVLTFTCTVVFFWYKKQIKRDKEKVTKIIDKLKEELT